MRVKTLTGLFLFLAACGSGEGLQEIQFAKTSGEAGYVHLNIANAVGSIAQFRIQIEGDNFATITQTLSSDAAGVEIKGIPHGTGRIVRIWALNAAGQILREGILENIAITGGQIQNLDVSLEAVPLVFNLTDGGYQSNRRLAFYVLTDPNHRIGIEGHPDVATGSYEKAAGPDGRVRFYPGILPAGEHVFQIIDHDSGKKRSLHLHLWEGQDIGPAPFMATGLVEAL